MLITAHPGDGLVVASAARRRAGGSGDAMSQRGPFTSAPSTPGR